MVIEQKAKNNGSLCKLSVATDGNRITEPKKARTRLFFEILKLLKNFCLGYTGSSITPKASLVELTEGFLIIIWKVTLARFATVSTAIIGIKSFSYDYPNHHIQGSDSLTLRDPDEFWQLSQQALKGILIH